jgi:hypothetical protein
MSKPTMSLRWRETDGLHVIDGVNRLQKVLKTIQRHRLDRLDSVHLGLGRIGVWLTNRGVGRRIYNTWQKGIDLETEDPSYGLLNGLKVVSVDRGQGAMLWLGDKEMETAIAEECDILRCRLGCDIIIADTIMSYEGPYWGLSFAGLCPIGFRFGDFVSALQADSPVVLVFETSRNGIARVEIVIDEYEAKFAFLAERPLSQSEQARILRMAETIQRNIGDCSAETAAE